MRHSAIVFAALVVGVLWTPGVFGETHWGDDITTDTTWTLANSPYIVDNTITIYDSATLTIESGVEVYVAYGARINVGRDVTGDETDCGALVAENTTFSSDNGEWARWYGLLFEGRGYSPLASQLTGCTVMNAGLGWTPCVHFSAHSNAVISGCTVHHNYAHGITCDADSAPTIADNDFTDNNYVPLSLYANAAANTSGNTFSGNANEYILVSGNLSESGTWTPQGTYYQLGGTMTIWNAATLTIEDGAEVRAANAGQICVGQNVNADETDQGALVASGVTFTSDDDSIGRWYGVIFEGRGYDPLPSSLVGCTVRNSGHGSARGVTFYSHSNVTASGCTIGPNQNGGVYCDSDSGPAIVDNLFTENHSDWMYPLYLSANHVRATSGNEFVGNDIDAIGVEGDVTVDGRWQDQGVPYRLQGAMTIWNSATLTLDSGVEIRALGSIYVGRRSAYDETDRGALMADRAAFNAHSDAMSGWSGIVFEGRGFAPLASSVTRCTVKNSGQYSFRGITFYGHSAAGVSECTIGPNGAGGIYCDENSGPTIVNNLFTGNQLASNYPMFLFADHVKATSGNRFVGNDIDAIGVSGYLSTSGTWTDQGVPYDLTGHLLVYNSAELTLDAGVRILHIAGGNIWVGQNNTGDEADRGALVTKGVTSNPVYIGTETGGPGSWCGLVFDGRGYDPLPSILEGCVVDLGGRYGTPAINVLSHDNVDFNRVTVVRNQYTAFSFSGSSPLVQNSIAAHNGAWGVEAKDGSAPVIEYSCFWSNSSGNFSGCTPGAGVIEVDPELADPTNGDYHLTSGSLCIDTGTGTAADGTVTDMGAYQFGGDVAAPDPEPYGSVALFGEPGGGYPGWVWFSIPLYPTGPAEPPDVLGFDCSGNVYYWDKYSKSAQVYQPPFLRWDLVPGDSYLLYLEGAVDNPVYFGENPDLPFEFKLGKMGWTWVGMPSRQLLVGDDFMSLVKVKYPSEDTGCVRTAQDDYDATPDNWVTWGWSFWDTGAQAPKTFTPYAPFGNKDCCHWLGYRVWVNVGAAGDEADPDQVTLIWP